MRRALLVLGLLCALPAAAEGNTKGPMGIHDDLDISAVYGRFGWSPVTAPDESRESSLFGVRFTFATFEGKTAFGSLAGVEFSGGLGYSTNRFPVWLNLDGFAHVVLVNAASEYFGFRMHLLPAMTVSLTNGFSFGAGFSVVGSIIPALTLEVRLLGYMSYRAMGSFRVASSLVIEPLYVAIGIEASGGATALDEDDASAWYVTVGYRGKTDD